MRTQLVAISLAVSGCGGSGASGNDARPFGDVDAQRGSDAPSAIVDGCTTHLDSLVFDVPVAP